MITSTWGVFPGNILCMLPANERQHHIVTSSLIGWTHTQNDPCISNMLSRSQILRALKISTFIYVWTRYFVLNFKGIIWNSTKYLLPPYTQFSYAHIWQLWRQKQVSRTGISNYIPQFTVGCNYLSLPEIPASGNKVKNCWMISWVTYKGIMKLTWYRDKLACFHCKH